METVAEKLLKKLTEMFNINKMIIAKKSFKLFRLLYRFFVFLKHFFFLFLQLLLFPNILWAEPNLIYGKR